MSKYQRLNPLSNFRDNGLKVFFTESCFASTNFMKIGTATGTISLGRNPVPSIFHGRFFKIISPCRTVEPLIFPYKSVQQKTCFTYVENIGFSCSAYEMPVNMYWATEFSKNKLAH